MDNLSVMDVCNTLHQTLDYLACLEIRQQQWVLVAVLSFKKFFQLTSKNQLHFQNYELWIFKNSFKSNYTWMAHSGHYGRLILEDRLRNL